MKRNKCVVDYSRQDASRAGALRRTVNRQVPSWFRRGESWQTVKCLLPTV
jgi:hypothetical protein